MKIPMQPPKTEALFANIKPDRLPAIFLSGVGPTPSGKYRHWDVLRHLAPPSGLTSEEWWLAIKVSRLPLLQWLPLTDAGGAAFRYGVFDTTQRMLHEVDKNATGVIQGSEQVTDPHTRDTYLLKSLVEEAITSSQLEGAATTRDVAKDMLQRGREPRDRSERMIYNNYAAMQLIRSLKGEPLTPSIVLELQRTLTEKTLDDPGAAGRYRRGDEPIVVSDQFGTILHRPPDARRLEKRLELMCRFANDTAASPFVHPVIRAILLHFWLAYDHPFVDGNGRTARGLFYWSMATQGYWLCEFLSISRILKRAPAAYGRSFLHAETDDNDATYFVQHQLGVIIRAIEDLHAYLNRKAAELRETREFMRRSAALQRLLNHRQLSLVNHALKNAGFVYTIESHRNSHGVTYQTSRTDLLELARHRLLDRDKSGRKFVFVAPRDLRARLRRR